MLIKFVRLGKNVLEILSHGAFQQSEGRSMHVAEAEAPSAVQSKFYSASDMATVEAKQKASVGGYLCAYIVYKQIKRRHTTLTMTLFSGSSLRPLFRNMPLVRHQALFAPPV